MIDVNGLTKQFSNGRGVFDLSFSIAEGEAFGFLGPNGAGKSTTIRLLMGFIQADHGQAAIRQLDCWKEAAAIQIFTGYLPGEIAFIEGMTGREFLQLLADMRKMKDHTLKNELIERLQFDPDTPIRKMSKGMKQKVAITATFMHRPAVIILDEPTSGLDPLMQQLFINLVNEEKKRGTTFLFSSHSFQEIERTCDRAAIIKDGYLVAEKDVHQWQTLQRKVLEITVANEMEADRLEQVLNGERTGSNRVRVTVKGDFDSLIHTLADYHVLNLDAHAQSLEDIFMDYYDRRGEHS
ncbi:ABC transporter ATP-binding protein [Bacillus sp. FJAT-42315]|uniref:ABC transporter ATP-binding protein n=1 Tax=Bacillus sp. FJAT-42315 TaxID=2014077 RepID=UPI000C23F1A2|nr:ABC transporter ATP-binding protein [Bacillus sp. FJAT-42315]